MLSRTTRLFKTLSNNRNGLIRSYGAAPPSAGGAYPGVPGPNAKIMEVDVYEGDAIYSYKHQNFVVDPIQIEEAAEHMQSLINAKHQHQHGPNCNHDHDDHDDHDDHHDDHHHHVDPNEIEDQMQRGFFLNKPPGAKAPIPTSVLASVLVAPILAGIIASYVFDKNEAEDMDRFRENYYRANPELKEQVDRLTKKEYPLSH